MTPTTAPLPGDGSSSGGDSSADGGNSARGDNSAGGDSSADGGNSAGGAGTALADAMSEAEQFVADSGWDAPRQMFALVRTAELLAAEPGLAGQVHPHAGAPAGEFTPIAQDKLPSQSVADALATITWPDEVAGCVLVLEILAGTGEQQAEARLAAGVLRDRPGGACLLRWRHAPDGPVLRGADLAPGLLDALHGTFEP